jgi:hypothetical protein
VFACLKRFVTIGMGAAAGRLLVVVYTYRGENIVSARLAVLLSLSACLNFPELVPNAGADPP